MVFEPIVNPHSSNHSVVVAKLHVDLHASQRLRVYLRLIICIVMRNLQVAIALYLCRDIGTYYFSIFCRKLFFCVLVFRIYKLFFVHSIIFEASIDDPGSTF